MSDIDKSIDELGLPVKLVEKLQKEFIPDVRTLASKTERDLRWKGLMSDQIEDITAALKKIGMELAEY
jgi:DNA-directed RNA polymerase alpha subunit